MPEQTHNMLAKALKILEYVADRPKGATLTEVCTALEMPKSSARNLLNTFSSMGYLERNAASGLFTIGIRAFETGSKFTANNDFFHFSTNVLEELVKETGETAHLATLDRSEVVYINKFDCFHAVRMISTVGKRIPAHATAIGKALLSGKSDREISVIYQDTPLQRLTDATICELPVLLQQIQEVRRCGYATEREESTPGVSCIGMPVKDRQGNVVVGISIAVPQDRLNEGLMRFQPALANACQRLQTILY